MNRIIKRIQAIEIYLRLFPYYWRFSSAFDRSDEPFIQPYLALGGPAVDRENFLVEKSKDKRVVHFGFLDHPFTESKYQAGSLLHTKIKSSAAYAFGIDVCEDELKHYRDLTHDLDNALFDIQSDDPFPDYLEAHYDLFLFSEVLEHLKNPFRALENMLRLCQQNSGAELCITVPNAFSILGFFSALRGIEMVHPDHYYFFSPHTLTRLLRDTGFSDIELLLYSAGQYLDTPGITKHGVIAVCKV
jgi:hypothetical protein